MVEANLCVSAWLRKSSGESGDRVAGAVMDTVSRLALSINTSQVTGHSVHEVFQQLTQATLYKHLSRTEIQLALTLLCFLFLLRRPVDDGVEGKKDVKKFLTWSSKMNICLRELESDSSSSDPAVRPRRLSLHHLSEDPRGAQCDDHTLLRMLVAAKYGLETDVDTEAISGLHVTLAQVAEHQRRGEGDHLRQSLSSLSLPSHQLRQSEAVTALCLLMRAELLMVENKAQAALSVFKQLIQKKPDHIRAYLGVARCFESQGKIRQEIETLRTIVKIQQFKRTNKTDENDEMVNLDERIIETLFPAESVSLERNLLTLARRCYAMKAGLSILR